MTREELYERLQTIATEARDLPDASRAICFWAVALDIADKADHGPDALGLGGPCTEFEWMTLARIFYRRIRTEQAKRKAQS